MRRKHTRRAIVVVLIFSMFISMFGNVVCFRNIASTVFADDTSENNEFIKKNDRIADYSNLDGTNWMSGISGERKLNEINIPGTHDSAAYKLDGDGSLLDYYTSVDGLFSISKEFAQTQKLYIDEQLKAGIRYLDIRLNYIRYKKGDIVDEVLKNSDSFWGDLLKNAYDVVKNYIMINPLEHMAYTGEDDGTSLWLCHGKKDYVGTYYAQNHDGEELKFKEVLEWLKNFLKEHPTETIVLKFEAEVLNGSQSGHDVVFERLKNHLCDFSKEINPSTGKPYLHMQDDEFGAKYEDYPQLKDCRGQVVIRLATDQEVDNLGFMTMEKAGDHTYEKKDEGGYYDVQTKIDKLKEFYNTNNKRLPSDASHSDFGNIVYTAGTTNSDVPKYRPLGYAQEIHKELKKQGVFADKGKYYGWVRFDGAGEEEARSIWETNFSSDLSYCTVTVKSDGRGSEFADRNYNVLKGTKITLPDSIYSSAPESGSAGVTLHFKGWKKGDSTSILEPGETVTVDSDVTFHAAWSANPYSALKVVWQDADDLEKKRPSAITIRYTDTNAAQKTITVDHSTAWKRLIGGTDLRLTSVPSGYEATWTTEGKIKVLTLTHTPSGTMSGHVKISWNDMNNKNNFRPSEVRVVLIKKYWGYQDGKYQYLYDTPTKTISAADGWTGDFGELEKYKNGKPVIYNLYQLPINTTILPKIPTAYYSAVKYSGSNGYTVTDTCFVPYVFFIGSIVFDDANNVKQERPENVTIRLLADGQEIETKTVRPNAEGKCFFLFEISKLYQDGIDQNKQLSVELDPIAHYKYQVYKRASGHTVVVVPSHETTGNKGQTVTPASVPSYGNNNYTLSTSSSDSDSGGNGSAKNKTILNGKKSGRGYYAKSGKNSVIYVSSAVKGSAKKVVIPDTITIDKKKYKVTGVDAYAFVGKNNLRSVVIGNNVNQIRPYAFAGCKKLKKLMIKSSKLKSKKIKNCLKDSNIHSICLTKKAARTLHAYKKIFTKKITGAAKKLSVIKQ